MSIAVDAILYRQKGGVEKAVGRLARALLTHETPWPLHLFGSKELCETLASKKRSDGASLIRISYSSKVERILRGQMLSFRRKSIQLWHYLGYVIPPIPPKKPIIVSIYDIIALTHPHLCTIANRMHYSMMLPRTIARADRILVPSLYVKETILERFPSAEPRIRVMQLPLPIPDTVSNKDFQIQRSDCGQRNYLLFVGALEPKKNIPFLLRAYSRLPKHIRDFHQLWLAGHQNDRTRGQHEKLANDLGIAGQIHFLGYVSDEKMPALYRKASILLFPSLVEGYGYPPLESMALGTPAIVSDQGALPEIAGARGAIVSPLDVHEFSERIIQLLSDASLYRRASNAGLLSASRETWDDYARDLWRVYEEFL